MREVLMVTAGPDSWVRGLAGLNRFCLTNFFFSRHSAAGMHQVCMTEGREGALFRVVWGAEGEEGWDVSLRCPW